METKSIWSHFNNSHNYQLPSVRIKLLKEGKNNKVVFLGFTNQFLYLYYDYECQIPQKYIELSFQYKYQVIRKPATLKHPELSDQKGENIEKLGQIIGIQITKELNKKRIIFRGEEQELNKLRDILKNNINQLGFHQYFIVQKKIGNGNFASVYLAKRIEDDEWMAIKAFCKNTVYQEQNGKEGLINEITIMRSLNHPNLMKLYEVYETQNSIYMCLELLEGDQLYSLIRQKQQLNHIQIHKIMVGLLNGIKHMHQKGFMHRDLKLENILFKEQGNFDTVVIADFGLATLTNQQKYIYTKCGTPGFVAPEIINIHDDDEDATYSEVCDMYSLGVVYYILLTGQPVFFGKNYNQIVKKNQQAIVDYSHYSLKCIHEYQLGLLKMLLQPNPTKRITIFEAFNHDYFQLEFNNDDELEEEFAVLSMDDNTNLEQMIKKLNKEYIKCNSPNKKEENDQILGTETLKQDIDEDDKLVKMIMRTPVITGRTRTILPNHYKRGHLFSEEINLQIQGK